MGDRSSFNLAILTRDVMYSLQLHEHFNGKIVIETLCSLGTTLVNTLTKLEFSLQR